MYTLWLLALLVVIGCASTESADQASIEAGCELTSDWCWGCRLICVEGYEVKDATQDREVGEPGAIGKAIKK